MSLLALSRSLKLDAGKIIAFYGAGGKTTLLNRLAAELAGAGEKTVITTTTKIYLPPGVSPVLSENIAQAVSLLRRRLDRENMLVLGRGMLPGGKVAGIDPDWVERLQQETGAFFLVEADGAAGRPIKGYASYEPALPAAANLIIPVLGLDALGTQLRAEAAHRPEELAKILKISPGDEIAVHHLARCMDFMVERGLGRAPEARAVPVFNKIDRLETAESTVIALAKGMAGLGGAKRVLFTAGRAKHPVCFSLNIRNSAVEVAVSCVVLAAGTASRMGRDKLALEFRGRTVLEHTLEQSSGAGFGEIIVVTRPGTPWPERLAGRESCTVVINENYAAGMATSLRKGLACVDPAAQGVVFALGDQPLVPAEVYRLLVERYRSRLAPVTLPVHRGRRGNPVLFDRRTWPLLDSLEGDAGGRQLLPLLPEEAIDQVETDRGEVLVDLDTPEDYRTARQGGQGDRSLVPEG